MKKEKNAKKKAKKLSMKEYEKKVLELAEEGLTSEKIGISLKEQGIHPQKYAKKISGILRDSGQFENPDLKNIEQKLERIKQHLENNRQDKLAKREKDRIFSRLRRAKIYFKKL